VLHKQHAEGSTQVEELTQSAVDGDEVDAGRFAPFPIPASTFSLPTSITRWGIAA
jgi:hypothetical protein